MKIIKYWIITWSKSHSSIHIFLSFIYQQHIGGEYVNNYIHQFEYKEVVKYFHRPSQAYQLDQNILDTITMEMEGKQLEEFM